MPTTIHAILLVADNPARSLAQAVLLGAAGYRVECLPDGVDAVEHIRLSLPSALVVDLASCARATELCARLRASPEVAGLPIVVRAPELDADGPGWIAEGLASWIVDRYGTAELEDALSHFLGRPFSTVSSSGDPLADDREWLAVEALAANARLLTVAAQRHSGNEDTTPRASELVARLLVAAACWMGGGRTPERLGDIPTVRALVSAYVDDAGRRARSPVALVGELHAVHQEATRFVARQAQRAGLADGRAVTLVFELNRSFDVVVRRVVDECWKRRARRP